MVTYLPEEWGGHDVGSLLSSLRDPRYKCYSDTKLQAIVAVPQLHCVPVNFSAGVEAEELRTTWSLTSQAR